LASSQVSIAQRKERAKQDAYAGGRLSPFALVEPASWRGNGREDPSVQQELQLLINSRPPGPGRAWSTRGEGHRGGVRIGGSTAKMQKRGSGEGRGRSTASQARDGKGEKRCRGRGQGGNSCRRLGRDGEMARWGTGTAYDRLGPGGGLGTTIRLMEKLEVMRCVLGLGLGLGR
jgi:hypothetical protein